MKRYHILVIDYDTAVTTGLLNAESSRFHTIRVVWDRKLGGCGIVQIAVSGYSERTDGSDDEFKVIDNPEDEELAHVESTLRCLITDDGRLQMRHELFEEDRLPEFAGGPISKWSALHRRRNELSRERHLLSDKIADMSYRMREHDFDGDWDPNERNRTQLAQVDAELMMLDEAEKAITDERTGYEKEMERRQRELDYDIAREEAADEKTRWEEDGRPVDADYYGVGGDD